MDLMAESSAHKYNGGFTPALVCEDVFEPDGAPCTSPGTAITGEAGLYYFRGHGPYYDFLKESPLYYGIEVSESSAAQHRIGLVPSLPIGRSSRSEPERSARLSRRPLNVVHVGPFLARGGAEQSLIDLVQAVDPQVLRFSRHIAISSNGADPEYINELAGSGVVVEVGGAESIQEAADEADVILSWGVELDRYLRGRPRPLSVQIVHGDGDWNRYFLDHSRASIDHAVAVSHRVQRRVCRDVPTTVIYNGIHGRRLARARSRESTRAALGFHAGDFVAGFFGRLAAEKRIPAIIEGVARMPGHVKLLIVGQGHLEHELRTLAARLLPSRHAFTHAAGVMGDLYAASDAVCLASNQEGCSLVMLEAMLSGCPVVSTPVGAACELLSNRITGLLFDGSPVGLAEALQLLDDYPQWRRALADEGRRNTERFGYASRMARDYEHLLTNLWRQSRPA